MLLTALADVQRADLLAVLGKVKCMAGAREAVGLEFRGSCISVLQAPCCRACRGRRALPVLGDSAGPDVHACMHIERFGPGLPWTALDCPGHMGLHAQKHGGGLAVMVDPLHMHTRPLPPCTFCGRPGAAAACAQMGADDRGLRGAQAEGEGGGRGAAGMRCMFAALAVCMPWGLVRGPKGGGDLRAQLQ